MSKQNPKLIQKTTVKIWQPIIGKLDAKLDAACLRRDAYLAKVLECELDWLDQEVSIPNSLAAQTYVAKELDELDRKPVTLALPPELTKRLNEICARKRIVRDAFFNRLFFLLAASSTVIDRLLFGSYAADWRFEVWSENKHNGPFFQNGFYPLEPMIDPFWAVRCGLEMFDGDIGPTEEWVEPNTGSTIRIRRALGGEPMPLDSLYTTILDPGERGPNLRGLSCYVPDWLIPGNDAEKSHKAKLDELFI